MNYEIRIFNKETDTKYLKQMQDIADEGLSPGFLTDKVMSNFGNDDYFCFFAVDENDTVCCVSYGNFFGIEDAAYELRCSVEEVERLFPGVKVFSSHLGLSVRPDTRGNGIARKVLGLNRQYVLSRADVVFNDVWNRHGGEVPIVTLLVSLGAVFYKKLPKYWYDYPDLHCTLCNGRCVCDCDMYYYTKEGFKL